MNTIKVAKELVKIAKQLTAFDCMDAGDWYVDKEVVRRYDAIVDRVINDINSKLKKIGLPFDYSLQYHDDLVRGDNNSYETTLDQYGLDKENVGVALFSQQWDISVLPVAINVPLLNQYQY